MEEEKAALFAIPWLCVFHYFLPYFCFGVCFSEQTASLGLVCREQVECLVLALRGMSAVTLQPDKQSTVVLRGEEQSFLWVKALAQIFD